MQFSKSQTLDSWNRMLAKIYDGTQNYPKSAYEIHTHLTEVTGAFGKMLFKKKDNEAALQFLPKMFAWASTLFRKIRGEDDSLQGAILIKYPGVCPYCLKPSCECWDNSKPDIKFEVVRERFLHFSPSQDKSLNGLQLMFRNIYGKSWGLDNSKNNVFENPQEAMYFIYIRLVEELSEIAEAIRFHHLYPSNFNNEIADYFAWWFALVSNFHRTYNDERPLILADALLWSSYPGFCISCGLIPCDCRPGPVRHILSKPAINDISMVDGLTSAENNESYKILIREIREKKFRVVFPIACIRIDIDDLRKMNEISHSFGDTALTTVVSILRQKVRLRDRIFRLSTGSDEFAIVCQDYSFLEAQGTMLRVANALKQQKIKGKNFEGKEIETIITLSIGISECTDYLNIDQAFANADKAAIHSKQAGKDTITIL